MLSEEAFKIIFNDNLIDSSSLHGTIILIDGKVWTDSHYKRFLFKDREEALKVFYNTTKWHARHTSWMYSTDNVYRNRASSGYYSRYHYIGNYVFTPQEKLLCEDWKKFKKYLIDNKGFRTVDI